MSFDPFTSKLVCDICGEPLIYTGRKGNRTFDHSGIDKKKHRPAPVPDPTVFPEKRRPSTSSSSASK